MTTAALPQRLHTYLADPSLRPLWSAVRRRLESNRLTVGGTVTVELDGDAATRLSGLIGDPRRPVRPGRAQIRLDVLDDALRRSAAAAGLISVLTALDGPLTDRAADREQRQAAQTHLWALLDARLGAAGLAEAGWLPAFLDGVRRTGLLTRAGDDAAEAIDHAGAALREVAADSVLDGGDPIPEPRWELAELAGEATGDAHGLDDDRVAAALVLRAAAAAAEEPAPSSAAERRTLWERLGVTTDQVSGTVLVWGLRPPGQGRWAAMMRERAALGLVTHLTVQELRAVAGQPLAAAGQPVHACENPQVLQAAARAGRVGPLVCFAGNPASAGLQLLARLLGDGARVAYHGDFDWPGIRITGRLLERGAVPWRMTAHDYADAVQRLPAGSRLELSGPPAPTPWEPDLAARMRRAGTAVHEESLLPTLLEDLL
ncbi:TIGR02679 family protein [Modestobacter sp. I12A-02628]|uniref:TIGR02679 family protein n=1 Tax=Goekera deserti TaxID=2497753 RepID=A0A7K3WI14_9ACTN|nr:TIGR02679 family protein [Goekera deserti]MPQ96383.1 TIGR02679 family protein [Goekera deserti]NDI47305.1 TIGR02679 family protein [Goekera deserti]NEL56135.1 TIGR02679 family protein [Goekera deserti]